MTDKPTCSDCPYAIAKGQRLECHYGPEAMKSVTTPGRKFQAGRVGDSVVPDIFNPDVHFVWNVVEPSDVCGQHPRFNDLIPRKKPIDIGEPR